LKFAPNTLPPPARVHAKFCIACHAYSQNPVGMLLPNKPPEEAKNTYIAIQSTVSVHFMQAMEHKPKSERLNAVPFHMIFNTWLGLVHYYLLNGELFAPRESVLMRYKDALVECFMALIK